MRPCLILILLCLLTALAAVGALAVGSNGVDFGGMFSALLGQSDATNREIIFDLRLPRALNAFGCGALLALAGALLQALLRNPLADPFVLGISSGAGALSLIAMLFGAGAALTAAAGFGGALASTGILFLLAWRGGLLPIRLLLAGVILSAAWGALITLLLALAPDAPLRGMVFWLMGDLAQADSGRAWLAPVAAFVSLALAFPLARSLDALGQGELSAAALGVAVGRLRALALLLAALITALVVVIAGSIGFVGLVTPHLMRLAGLRRHRELLPACVFAGGTLLLLADVISRSVVAPLQLPVGAVTAALGAPMFLWLLSRSAKR
ncbi:MAG: iron ABC transporter permease [Rhodocyclaceae bacterium]|nr:iron ABC transporter permease [Rhodocyclaceae bacterium]